MFPILAPILALAFGSAAPVRPHAVVRPVDAADVRWTTGFWADRFEVCRTSTIPQMAKLMWGTDRSQFLHNFRVASGAVAGTHRGPAWNDGDFYKWLEAAAAVYAVAPDPALDARMDEAIAVIAAAQRPDGYLHTPVLIRNRNGDAAAKPFDDRLAFEMYNFGHLFTAAVVHHRATGKRSLLAVAVKAADFLLAAFETPTPTLARNSVCPAHYFGTLDLYRTTRDPRHLTLARKFLDLRDLFDGGTDDNQDRVLFRKQTEAVGHAVRANYLYAGAADLFLETGDETLLAPLGPIWESVAHRKMAVTGACGALYDGASPDGSKEQKQIARTHQAYGRDYQLPNSTAHNETCAAIGNLLWNDRMLQATGYAKHADVVERVLFNALLAGVSLDGTRFFYTNTLRQLDAMPAPLRWSRQREEWISCYCCPPNVARTVAQVHALAYGQSDRGLWVHQYGGNRLDAALPGGRIKLTQTTDYPWDGTITLALDAVPVGEFSLFLRVPGWSSGATLAVNGEPAAAAEAGRYAEVRRTWRAGDRVTLKLPMAVRLLEAHPLAEELRNQVAVQRGPVVYCVESCDLPAAVRVQSVAIPRTAAFRPRYDAKLLGGVAVLEGAAEATAAPAWGKELYRELAPTVAKAFDLRLIPHYAWGNRGKSEMTVWTPLGR
ncbi:glycoside hydrolase family 127 protein [Limnoglobus roseus]|uniref:Retaining beta-L-arabinofuranosidase n=1 Tax=Limnoglobus roseus TaxID=2598579 RepID=A0A5C1AM09_9BACT|nr:glycoside hydrolase family 127 protein [Limnoglobus roseus]QEL17948.1 retaining beta-L-arabinofuranosidase [Limnoglobus roseus]